MIKNHINIVCWVLVYSLLFLLGGCASTAYRAALTNDVSLLRKAISDGLNPRHSAPLIAAAKKGHHEIVRLLLEAGDNPNHTNNKNETALLWAAKLSHLYHRDVVSMIEIQRLHVRPRII